MNVLANETQRPERVVPVQLCNKTRGYVVTDENMDDEKTSAKTLPSKELITAVS